jgi:hypothetical protein
VKMRPLDGGGIVRDGERRGSNSPEGNAFRFHSRLLWRAKPKDRMLLKSRACPDRCLDRDCPTPADSRFSYGHVAVQTEGPRLFDGGAPWAE